MAETSRPPPLGPRLAGRLTAELILRSPQYMNCIRMYELCLRGACSPRQWPLQAACLDKAAKLRLAMGLVLQGTRLQPLRTLEPRRCVSLPVKRVGWTRSAAKAWHMHPPSSIARLVSLSSCLQNQFDSIDLTDNAVVRLEGFSKLHRLKHLLLSNNRLSRIAKGLEGKHFWLLHAAHALDSRLSQPTDHTLITTLHPLYLQVRYQTWSS